MLETIKVRTVLPKQLYHYVFYQRGVECPGCSGLEGRSFVESHKAEYHSCISKAGGVATGVDPVTDEEYKMAVNSAVAQQIVLAYLLYNNLATYKEVVELNVEE